MGVRCCGVGTWRPLCSTLLLCVVVGVLLNGITPFKVGSLLTLKLTVRWIRLRCGQSVTLHATLLLEPAYCVVLVVGEAHGLGLTPLLLKKHEGDHNCDHPAKAQC